MMGPLRGLPGHPLHPPLTDATIGMYTLAAGLAVLGALGVSPDALSKGLWLALVGGLIVSVPTALTGFADWIGIEWGTPLWRTATLHLAAMLVAVALFAVATWQQRHGYLVGEVTRSGLAATLAGFVALTLGGWLGGTIVFVHGMRVLARADAASAQNEERREGDRP